MRAIIIAVGSELLNLDRLDTNSIYIARRLREFGILTDMKMVVGDNHDYLAWVVRQAYKRAQIVITTGGLGPTDDDITREAVADAIQRELVFREDLVADIRERFRKRRLKMPDNNARQAFVIEGGAVLDNPVGTAPGIFLDSGPCRVLLLPGPPVEMRPMFDRVLEESIAPLSRYHVYTRSFRIAGVTESEADERLNSLIGGIRNLGLTILATPGLIEIRLMGRSRKDPKEAEEPVETAVARIREGFRKEIVTEREESFEGAILRLLQERGLTLALAESCTGGGLSNRITNVPGSSRVFLGGIVAYSNDLKVELLGVNPETLEAKGAVSPEMAAEMAEGIRRRTGADLGLSITGIAGPDGGVPGKPVGLVHMHLAAGENSRSRRCIFPGDRKVVKTRSENFALNLIREFLVGIE